jgi:two-component system sensor histidine kinase HydH
MRYLDTENNLVPAFNLGIWGAVEWSPEFWLTVFDKLPYPVVVFEEEGKIIFSNQRANKLLGLEGFVGSRLPVYLQSLVEGSRELTAGLRGKTIPALTFEGSYDFVVKNLPFEGLGPLFLAAGLKVSSDWKKEESPLSGLDEGTMMAGQVSHQVKGNLAGIELYASILDEELAHSGHSALTGLINEIRASLGEVNEYLTSLESMTNIMTLDLQSLNVAEVVDEALETLGGIFKAKNIGILVDQSPVAVLGDRRLLTQMFKNLFLNALEAMPGGGRLMINMRQVEGGMAEVVVADTGSGISLRQTKEIFNPFYTTKEQSLGLGLPVSRRIVEAHDGHMVVGSDMSGGARIAVHLPSLPLGTVLKGETARVAGGESNLQ